MSTRSRSFRMTALALAALCLAALVLSLAVTGRAQDEQAAPAPPAEPVDQSPFYELAKHGAVPGTDCTEALQRAFDTMPKHKKPILLPAGPLLISKTIVTPFVNGGKLIGAGRGQWIMPNTSLDGAVSSLVWVGEPGGTILEMRGTDMEVRDLAIYGSRNPRKKGQRKRAGIGILITKVKNGLGVGKHQFGSLFIQDCEVGIQIGQRPGEHNCDNLAFGFLTLSQCDTGFKVINGQAVGFKFGYLLSRGVGTTLDFHGGGNLWVDSWKIISGKVGLRIRDIGTPVTIGSNTACYAINNVKLDNNAREFKLIQQEINAPMTLVLNHGHVGTAVTKESPFIELTGNVSITLRDWYNIRPGMIVGKLDDGAKPNIVLDRCRLSAWGEPQDYLTGQGYLKLRDCVDGANSKPLAEAVVEQ